MALEVPGDDDKHNECNFQPVSSTVAFEYDLQNELDQLYVMLDVCFQFHSKHRITAALKQLSELQGRVELLVLHLMHFPDAFEGHEDLVDKISSLEAVVHSSKPLVEIRSQSNLLEDFEERFMHMNWDIIRTSDGLEIFTADEGPNAINCIKAVGVMRSPPLNVLAVIHEIDLLPTISRSSGPRVTVSTFEGASSFEKTVYQRLHLPWPLKDRDLLLSARAFDQLDEKGCITVVAKSTSTALLALEHFYDKQMDTEFSNNCEKGLEECERICILSSGAVIEPLSDSHCKVSLFMQIDLKLHFVPSFFVNFLAKHLVFRGFKQFESISASLKDSPYESRIHSNLLTFVDIQDRLASFNGKPST